MQYHIVVNLISDLLKQNGFWFETFEHEPVRTSEEAANIRDGYDIHQGAKALIVRIKISKTNKKFVVLVIPGDLKFEVNKVKLLFGAKDVRFATPQEVFELTSGVQPGGVPPFGNLFNLETIVDPSLLENEKIVFNAGDKSFSIAMKSSDYQKIVNPVVKSIVQT
jgi:prolyl-tRNA editing enzyme YbaK/EbsC (Cys-tRNA(Pro) deacylase)